MLANRLVLSLFAIGVLLVDVSARADSYTFSLVPASGSVSGTDGSTIGWGYSITNQSTADWFVATNLAAGSFADATADSSVFDFPIIAPGATVTENYDPVAGTGLYAITWLSTAPINFIDSGNFTLSGAWYTGDPTVSGVFIQNALNSTAAYSATVTGSVVSTVVPEPAAYKTLTLGLLMTLAFVGWRRLSS